MSHLKASYSDYSTCCAEFIKGIQYLEHRLIHEAISSFQQAYQSVNGNDPHLNKYISYCGFARFLGGDMEGLQLCRVAVKTGASDGDVYLNLARAEYLNSNRKQTVVVLEQGLQVDKQHQGLKLLRQRIGVRRRKPIPLLSRNNPVSHMVGKLLRKTKS